MSDPHNRPNHKHGLKRQDLRRDHRKLGLRNGLSNKSDAFVITKVLCWTQGNLHTGRIKSKNSQPRIIFYSLVTLQNVVAAPPTVLKAKFNSAGLRKNLIFQVHLLLPVYRLPCAERTFAGPPNLLPMLWYLSKCLYMLLLCFVRSRSHDNDPQINA